MVKQVIVVRKDLKMRRGKEIAQGSHASIAFLTRRLTLCGYDCANSRGVSLSDAEKKWLDSGFTKVTLQVESEEELMKVHQAAVDAGLESHVVIDSGKTEFNGVPTKTCIAIGPDYAEKIDAITGPLKLYQAVYLNAITRYFQLEVTVTTALVEV